MKFDDEICKGVSCPECSFNKGEGGCLLAKRLDEIEIIPEPCEELDFVQEHKKIPVVLDIQQKGKSVPSFSQTHENDQKAEWVEIIRCEECKYFRDSGVYTYCERVRAMGANDIRNYMTEEYDFCSHAVRREEGEE